MELNVNITPLYVISARHHAAVISTSPHFLDPVLNYDCEIMLLRLFVIFMINAEVGSLSLPPNFLLMCILLFNAI